MQGARLFPFALATRQAVLPMAVGAILFLGGAGEEGFVLLGVELLLGVTPYARLIHLRSPVHNIRSRAVFPPGPGLVGNVFVRVTVAVRTADVGPGMEDRDILLHVVHVADEAATVIGHGARLLLGI